MDFYIFGDNQTSTSPNHLFFDLSLCKLATTVAFFFYLPLQRVIYGVLHLGSEEGICVPRHINQLQQLKCQNFLLKAFWLKIEISTSKSNMAAHIKHKTYLRNKPLFPFSMFECPELVVCIPTLLVTNFPGTTPSTCSCWICGSIRK